MKNKNLKTKPTVQGQNTLIEGNLQITTKGPGSVNSLLLIFRKFI